MEKPATTDAVESEEIPDSFLCCICLDLIFKPIVLPCGHFSCFWCVHKSMNGRQQSNCPFCRNPYNHFPTISEMLHALLLKLYPITYRMREEQILVEEKEMGFSSPQFNHIASEQPDNQEHDHLKDNGQSSTTGLDSNSCLELCSTKEGEAKGSHKRLSITDVQCTACNQVLYRPVFLNCGHGYCETCISYPVDDVLRCQACHSLHPTGFPKVCLGLDNFLKEQFSTEYALRRDAVQLKPSDIKIENPTNSSSGANKKGFPLFSMLNVSRSKLHIGAGCDFCGMYPIIGDRYRCKDCVEEIGFDLCGDCYNTRTKRPGRFNQQHTPEHKLERVYSNNILVRLWRQLHEDFEDGSIALVSPDDLSDVPESESPSPLVFVDDEEVGTHVTHTESSNDQNETESTS